MPKHHIYKIWLELRLHAKFQPIWTWIGRVIAIRTIVDAPLSFFSTCILETGKNVPLIQSVRPTEVACKISAHLDLNWQSYTHQIDTHQIDTHQIDIHQINSHQMWHSPNATFTKCDIHQILVYLASTGPLQYLPYMAFAKYTYHVTFNYYFT